MKRFKPEGAQYDIEKQAGEGLTANVFKAVRRDSRGHSRQTVALKILKSETAIPWLRREFDTLARVNSPHCVRVLAWENGNDGCALVLEWIDGLTLFDLARSESLSLDLIEEIVAQIELGLRDLDREGLHHGDLSPKNVLIDRRGCVKIVDFATYGLEGAAIQGTPAYIAPEIWRGESTSIEADLFALALISADTSQSFFGLPSDVNEARARSLARATEGPGPLSIDPSLRSWSEARSIDVRRRALGFLVSTMMEARTAQTHVTAVMPAKFSGSSERHSLKSKSSKRFKGIAGALICIGMTASVLADSPLVVHRPPGLLTIASHRWAKIAIDGREVGFAPLSLQVSPGEHLISWEGPDGTFTSHVEIRSGEQLHLSNPKHFLTLAR